MSCYTPIDIPASGEKTFVDYSRWKLTYTEDGGHIWKYLKTDEEIQSLPQTVLDKYWLGLPLVRVFSCSSHDNTEKSGHV